MARERVPGLFKLGHRVHMEEPVREGHLHMRLLHDFARMESDVLRADEDEALAHAIAAKGAELSVNRDGRWELIGTIDGPIRFSDPGLQRANVFCMHAFPSSRVEDLVDQRNFGFGDTYVVFTEGDEFLRRVRAEALRLKIELQCSLVEYVDPSTYRGAMGIFRKFSSFSYQSECRLALLPGTGEPYSLWVGEGSCQSGRYRTSRRPLLWPTRAEHRGPAAGVGAHRRAV